MALVIGQAQAQDFFEQAPIRYSESKPTDPISILQKSIDADQVELVHAKEHGYLRGLLKALKISPKSQLLVYSKTSLQLHRISPYTPRAIYFNDDVYVGFIPGSDRLEISSADPALGGVFYTLSQDKQKNPRFVRDQGNCLACHANSRTQDVPGHLIRSVYTSANGQPHYGMGTHLTTQESDFQERFGGWYITGTHGSIRHLGNLIVKQNGDKIERDAGANIVDLSKKFRTDRYLTPHSDLVAMMVLTHQAEMHNLITLVNFQTRQAIHQGKVMNKALDRPEDFVSESTINRVNSAVEKLLRYLLFADEKKLDARITGTSGFREYFESLGPFDKQGRSLRQLDLETRTFKYPCSYLIYSKSFQRLPVLAKSRIISRINEILAGKDQSGDFDSLTAKDRQAIREILRDTLVPKPKVTKPKSTNPKTPQPKSQ